MLSAKFSNGTECTAEAIMLLRHAQAGQGIADLLNSISTSNWPAAAPHRGRFAGPAWLDRTDCLEAPPVPSSSCTWVGLLPGCDHHKTQPQDQQMCASCMCTPSCTPKLVPVHLQEDSALSQRVAKYGTKSWTTIAAGVEGRSAVSPAHTLQPHAAIPMQLHAAQPLQSTRQG